MDSTPNCQNCNSDYVYEVQGVFTCPECGHEWSLESESLAANEDVICDANGQPLKDGDTVTVIKDLKVKGSSLVVKVGTKVKNIRLIDGANGHDIDCKIKDVGAMQLKSQFVKKV